MSFCFETDDGETFDRPWWMRYDDETDCFATLGELEAAALAMHEQHSDRFTLCDDGVWRFNTPVF